MPPAPPNGSAQTAPLSTPHQTTPPQAARPPPARDARPPSRVGQSRPQGDARPPPSGDTTPGRMAGLRPTPQRAGDVTSPLSKNLILPRRPRRQTHTPLYHRDGLVDRPRAMGPPPPPPPRPPCAPLAPHPPPAPLLEPRLNPRQDGNPFLQDENPPLQDENPPL